MSITKSYNKHTGKTYAYDTRYVWDEKLQKNVQKRTCVGQYDPETGEIVPNGKRGRPQRKQEEATGCKVSDCTGIDAGSVNGEAAAVNIREIVAELNHMDEELSLLSLSLQKIRERLKNLGESLPEK